MKTPNPGIEEKQLSCMMIALVLVIAIFYSMDTHAQEIALSGTGSLTSMQEQPTLDLDFKIGKENLITAVAESMSKTINTQFMELKPVLTPDGNRIYFSRLPFQATMNKNKHDEDIWFTDFQATSNTWLVPARLAGELNNAGPNFVNCISAGGDTLILGNQYLKKGKMCAGLSYSVSENGYWSAPKTIKIKNDYNISEHANHYVSFESKVIISAIERAETVGSRDLYVSFWNGKTATEPMNMGMIVNSDAEESSPFLLDDGKTLFFASKGHNTYGGFDIFMTTRLDDSWTNWSAPVNLGPSVNGVLDDEHFVVTRCKKYAMFSKQVSSNNVDLFRISIEELTLHGLMRNTSASNAFGSL